MKHGHAKASGDTSTYSAWCAMVKRCTNAANKDFGHYGGRGIGVCEKWRNSFQAFLEDMGVRPAGMSIERRNVNGNYEPSNCHWATRQEQANNTRSNVFVVSAGRSTTMAAYARERAIDYDRLRRALKSGSRVICGEAIEVLYPKGNKT